MMEKQNSLGSGDSDAGSHYRTPSGLLSGSNAGIANFRRKSITSEKGKEMFYPKVSKGGGGRLSPNPRATPTQLSRESTDRSNDSYRTSNFEAANSAGSAFSTGKNIYFRPTVSTRSFEEKTETSSKASSDKPEVKQTLSKRLHGSSSSTFSIRGFNPLQTRASIQNSSGSYEKLDAHASSRHNDLKQPAKSASPSPSPRTERQCSPSLSPSPRQNASSGDEGSARQALLFDSNAGARNVLGSMTRLKV